MNNFTAGICGISVLALLSGCSTAQVPYTQNHPVAHQKVARAVNHWDILADDVAAQTVASIGTQKSIYVSPAQNATDFNQAFHNLLITRLVNKQAVVSNQKMGAIEVQYETQVITHNSQRSAYKAGTLTALAAGLMVAYNVPNWTHTEAKMAALLGAAAGADVAASTDAGSPTKTELVVTTSAIENGRYLVRKTDIYYVQPEDVPLFMKTEKAQVPVKMIGVVGDK